MYLIFDTETTGLPRNWKAPVTQLDNWPRVVQLGWMLFDASKSLVGEANVIVQPAGFTIPPDAARIHGITQARAMAEGVPMAVAMAQFKAALHAAQVVIAHNLDYDQKVMGAEFLRAGMPDLFQGKRTVCTKQETTDFCKLPGPYGFKWPTLDELHRKLFSGGFEHAHDALGDVRATARCYFELVSRGILR